MKILFGLGNPGKKYLLTRHNLGFMLLDFIAETDTWRKKQSCLVQEITIGGRRVLLAKPQTFMNLSGKAVREMLNFYKTPLEDLLIIQDDKDQAFGQLKFQRARGDGGHRGIQNIHQELGSKDYGRLKMGIAPAVKEKLSAPSPPETNRETAQKTNKGKLSLKTLLSFPQNHFNPFITSSSKNGTAQFVLSAFEEEERKKLPAFLKLGAEAARSFIEKGFERSANQFNSKI